MKTENEFYILMTKFGFIQDTYEDYTDVDEKHPLSILYNVAFTSNPSRAAKFNSTTQSPYKYSNSKKYHWSELTVEKWAEEIEAKLIKCKTTQENRSEFKNGIFVSFEHKEFSVLDKEFNQKTKFEEFNYEALELGYDE